MVYAIELNNLSKIYSQKNGSLFKAVDNITLSIPKGQVMGFLGPNGAGKTTTIKMICNLITPTIGSIKLHGYILAQNRDSAMRQIGAVLEGTRNIYWQLSAWQNLMYFGRLKGIWGKALNNQAEHLLKELSLWDRKDESISGFSRGMQQKVAIACALITNPPVILLDEPTLGLDAHASLTIKNWIEHLAHNENKTIILTTHQLDIAQELCKRIVIINKGKIIEDNATTDILKAASQDIYKIIVLGNSDKLKLVPGVKLVESDDHTFTLEATANQEILYNQLNILRELNLRLFSITQTQLNLEEIFINLIQKENAI